MNIVKIAKSLDLIKFEPGRTYYFKVPEENIEVITVCCSRTSEKAEFIALHSFSGPLAQPFFELNNVYIEDLIVEKVDIIQDGDSSVVHDPCVPLPINLYFEVGVDEDSK